MPIYNLAYTSLSSALEEFTTFFSSAFTFITSNWLIAAAVCIPIICGLIAAIISFIRR